MIGTSLIWCVETVGSLGKKLIFFCFACCCGIGTGRTTFTVREGDWGGGGGGYTLDKLCIVKI